MSNDKTPSIASRSETAPGSTRIAPLGIQSDTAFNEASRRLAGRDLCSVGDLAVDEMAAIMELAHTVKAHPEDFRTSLDAKQMVLFFESFLADSPDVRSWN